MNWTLISNGTTDLKEYHLQQEEAILAVMKYNPEQQTVRVAYEHERLVYFMELSGNRITFKSSYGISLGRCTHHARDNSGRLEINNEVFDYQIAQGHHTQLTVYAHSQQEPLAVSQLPDNMLQDASLYELAALVLSVCMYAGMPVERRKQDL